MEDYRRENQSISSSEAELRLRDGAIFFNAMGILGNFVRRRVDLLEDLHIISI